MPDRGKSNTNVDDEYLPSRGHRAIPRKSPFHFVGQLTYLNSQGKSQAIGFGSLLEYHVAFCCIYRSDFLDIEEQLAPKWVRHGGVHATPRWLDFRLTLKSERRRALSVKPEATAKCYVYREEMRAVAQVAVPDIADALCVVTERNIDPVELANAKLLHSARHPEELMDDQVEAELARLDRPVPIRDFLNRCGIGGAGFWSVVRAIRAGIVEVAAGECITASSSSGRRRECDGSFSQAAPEHAGSRLHLPRRPPTRRGHRSPPRRLRGHVGGVERSEDGRGGWPHPPVARP